MEAKGNVNPILPLSERRVPNYQRKMLSELHNISYRLTYKANDTENHTCGILRNGKTFSDFHNLWAFEELKKERLNLKLCFQAVI